MHYLLGRPANFSQGNLKTLDLDELHSSYANLTSNIANFNESPGPCKKTLFSVHASTYSYNTINEPFFKGPTVVPPYFILAFTYTTLDVNLEESYFIHDLDGFVSSLGGNVGLFLGFSIWTWANSVIDFLAIKHQNKGNK